MSKCANAARILKSDKSPLSDPARPAGRRRPGPYGPRSVPGPVEGLRRLFMGPGTSLLLALLLLLTLSGPAGFCSEEPADDRPATAEASEEPAAPDSTAEEELSAVTADAPEPEQAAPEASVLPPLDGAADLSSIRYSWDIVQLRIYELQNEDRYRNGASWGDGRSYTSPTMGGSTACLAFAYEVSDHVFDDLPTRRYYKGQFTYDDIRVGDILWEREWVRHAVVVLEKYDDHLVFVEGNFNSAVLWGRTKSRQDCMDLYEVLITRYPVHLMGDATGDKCVNRLDAAALLQYLTRGKSLKDDYASDIDRDGYNRAADAAEILKLAALKEDGLFFRDP